VIRPVTMFWVALAGCVGFGLYHLKNEVQALEDELFRANRTILAEQESIHVLRAEWSYLNQPARLQALASRHLDLQPTKPSQLGTIATLPPLPQDAAAPPALAAVPSLPPAPVAAPPRVAALRGRSTRGLN
jgi:cell division protein FtsL